MRFLHRYLNRKLVFASDLFLVLAGTIFTHFIVNGLLLGRPFYLISSYEWLWSLVSLLLSALLFYLFKTHRRVIRHSTLRDLSLFFGLFLIKGGLQGLLFWVGEGYLSTRMPTGHPILFATVFDFMTSLLLIIGMRVVMLEAYMRVKRFQDRREERSQYHQRVLIYGSGEEALGLKNTLDASPDYEVCGFIVPPNTPIGFDLGGKRVYSFMGREDAYKVFDSTDAKAVVFTNQLSLLQEKDRLVSYITSSHLNAYLVPELSLLSESQKNRLPMREVKVEDLLGRPEIKISEQLIRDDIAGKRILVTGAAGSIGSELCRQLAKMGASELILFDNAETPLHNLSLEFHDKFPSQKIYPIVGDVRLLNRLDFVFRTYRPEIVYHAAAYKHVPLMEDNPCEAVLVNAVGSRQVADKCLEYGVSKMVMVSTDKAVNPTNIMGCTKRLAEIYVQSLGIAVAQGKIPGKTKFITTRFGNVLGSNGSVIPRFAEQIKQGGPVTVTHREINRFFMTIPEACRLVMEASVISEGNEILVFEMGEPVYIYDMAKRMIELAGYRPDVDIPIHITGLRKGEKLYEEVLSKDENIERKTSHERVLIAKVRTYDYAEALEAVVQLEEYSRQVQIVAMTQYMKQLVPEYTPTTVFTDKGLA